MLLLPERASAQSPLTKGLLTVSPLANPHKWPETVSLVGLCRPLWILSRELLRCLKAPNRQMRPLTT